MKQKSIRKNVLQRGLITLLLLPILLFVYFVATGNYYAFYFDEAIYLTGAKLFYETWSLKVLLSFDEMRSKIGDLGIYSRGQHYTAQHKYFFSWSMKF